MLRITCFSELNRIFPHLGHPLLLLLSKANLRVLSMVIVMINGRYIVGLLDLVLTVGVLQ